MEIRINDNPIDFVLEGEQTLLEVLRGLQGWIEQQGYRLLSARMSNAELDLARTEELSKTGVAEIGRLDLVVEPESSRLLQDLQSIRRFFHLLVHAIEADERESAMAILPEYPFVRSSSTGDGPSAAGPTEPSAGSSAEAAGAAQSPVRESLRSWLELPLKLLDLSIPGGSPAEIEALIRQSGLFESGRAAGESREALLSVARTMDRELEERIAEIIDPRLALRSTALGIRSSITGLQQVPVLLQTGKDREAMAAIIGFTEQTVRLVRLFPLLRRSAGLDLAALEVEGTSLPDFYADFNAALTEVIDAFGKSDSVLIGDLLEYEIAPRLEKLGRYIDLIVSS